MTRDVPCFALTPSVCHPSQQSHYSSLPQPQPISPWSDQTPSANYCFFHPYQQAGSSSDSPPQSISHWLDQTSPANPCVFHLSQQGYSSFP